MASLSFIEQIKPFKTVRVSDEPSGFQNQTTVFRKKTLPITWHGSEIPGLIRMLRREHEAQADQAEDGLETMRRVNLMAMVRAIVNELRKIKDIELHINSSMGCDYGSIRYVFEGHTFWSLPVPGVVCNEVIATFKLLAQMDPQTCEWERTISWPIGEDMSVVKVMAKPTEKTGQRLVVWVEMPSND